MARLEFGKEKGGERDPEVGRVMAGARKRGLRCESQNLERKE
jgi:hypothetical protein